MSDLRDCQLCPRLTSYRQQQKARFPAYSCLPVAGFGARDARLLIIGLAPGLHGANATGRPFTGDASGDMLFQFLFNFGFASQAESHSSDDEMRLVDCRITNAVKCVPPQNKPNTDEITRCNFYLRDEIDQMQSGSVLLALGAIAHRSVLKAVGIPQSRMGFYHLAEYPLENDLRLIDSYHCSRYNINTGRLSQTMFESVFARIQQVLS